MGLFNGLEQIYKLPIRVNTDEYTNNSEYDDNKQNCIILALVITW